MISGKMQFIEKILGQVVKNLIKSWAASGSRSSEKQSLSFRQGLFCPVSAFPFSVRLSSLSSNIHFKYKGREKISKIEKKVETGKEREGKKWEGKESKGLSPL
jgi:hypothetical protein